MESNDMNREFPKKGRPSFPRKLSSPFKTAVSILKIATQLEESSMKKMFVLITVLALASLASAQIGAAPATDVLGAHLNYGRGCAGCHAPHSGAYGNGAAKTADTSSGDFALWGQDVGSLYGKTLTTGQMLVGGNGTATTYTELLPSTMNSAAPDVSGLITCLSCHDGNYAQGAMMKNQVFETLPATYGTYNKIPTLLGNNGAGDVGDYLNDHPVGLNATVSCTGAYNWDCTETNGVISMTGPNSSRFVTNYGFFVSLSAYNNTAVVTCTSCHNQHVMNVVKVTQGATSGLASGYYQTMFFIRAPYNPASTTPGSNQTAQFCRQCHGGEANESNAGTAGTIF
jgi:cytochrome c553